MKIKWNILVITITVAAIVSIVFFWNRQRVEKKVVQEKAKAMVAIVIDDWGYNLHNIEQLTEINVPLTISILPNLRYSSRIAEIAHNQRQEVILHLPLEPELNGREYIGLEENTITTQMPEEDVVDNLKTALASVPGACGVSNHMGSRATKDSALMSIIFTELGQRKLFFLDNCVTLESICSQLAQKMQIRFAARDVFLDNQDEVTYIKEQLKELSELALAKNYAVGIGHAKAPTLQALREEIPSMQEKGIKFVFISDLVN